MSPISYKELNNWGAAQMHPCIMERKEDLMRWVQHRPMGLHAFPESRSIDKIPMSIDSSEVQGGIGRFRDGWKAQVQK